MTDGFSVRATKIKDWCLMNSQSTFVILTYFLTQGNGFIIKNSSTWQLWITQPSKTKLYQYLGPSLKFWRMWILPHSKISWHTYFMAPFYGRGSTASRLDPLRGGSLLFTTKYPGITSIYFINLGRMKGWTLEPPNEFWTRDPWIGDPVP